MPKSFKSIILIILLLLGVSPLYGNLPCEDGGCSKKCKCENTESAPGGNKNDGGTGNASDQSGTDGTNIDSVSIWVNWGSPANENVSGELPPRLSFGGEYSFLWFL